MEINNLNIHRFEIFESKFNVKKKNKIDIELMAEIITNKEVQEHLQNKVEEAQTRYNNNPSFKNESKLKRAQMDLDNATRDGEVLIKGIVPKEYITVVNN